MPAQAINFASIYNSARSWVQKAASTIPFSRPSTPLMVAGGVAALTAASCAALEISENYQDKIDSNQLISQIACNPGVAVDNYLFISTFLFKNSIPFEIGQEIFKPELVIEKLQLAQERYSLLNLPITKALAVPASIIVGLAAYKLSQYYFRKK